MKRSPHFRKTEINSPTGFENTNELKGEYIEPKMKYFVLEMVFISAGTVWHPEQKWNMADFSGKIVTVLNFKV